MKENKILNKLVSVTTELILQWIYNGVFELLVIKKPLIEYFAFELLVLEGQI